MTVGAPALDAISGVREHALALCGPYVLEAALLGEDSTVGWRLKGKDPPGRWRTLAGGAWAGRKQGLSCLVMANELLLAWSAVASGQVTFARWGLLLGTGIQAPTVVTSGQSTALVTYGLTKLALLHTVGGINRVVVSPDRGATWPGTLKTVDAGNGAIERVDADTTNPAAFTIRWAETDTPP